MIDAFFTLVLSPLTWLVSQLPAWTTPTSGGAAEAFTYLAHAASAFGPWVNIPAFVTAIGLVVGFVGVVVAIKALLWVYGLVPAKAT